MTYEKPNIIVLGDAASVIHGSGTNHLEDDKLTPRASGIDGDLDE